MNIIDQMNQAGEQALWRAIGMQNAMANTPPFQFYSSHLAAEPPPAAKRLRNAKDYAADVRSRKPSMQVKRITEPT